MMNATNDISVSECVQLLQVGATLLDVREDDEFEEGHAPGALHIRMHEVPDCYEDLPRESVIVCVCRVGARSARVAEYLATQGFDARNLSGGMLAWVEAREPLESTGATARII